MRPSGRNKDQMRDVRIKLDISDYAEGSCLVHFGNTRVFCTASIEEFVPRFLKGTGKGWVTAEYGMLPRSTHTRMQRESSRGGPSGRTQEIQRLIGRSLRAITNLQALGERQISIDCDVINADGGTRTAAITGAYVALHLACKKLVDSRILDRLPLTDTVAAVSCGIYKGEQVLDLDYSEDSNAEADANFVLTGKGNIVEVQGTAEEEPFTEEQFMALLSLAKKGVVELSKLQKEILELE